MRFMEKLKNIFFEEEEEDEVEETLPPKSEKKKEKLKETIAKKVEIPVKREEDEEEKEIKKEIKKEKKEEVKEESVEIKVKENEEVKEIKPPKKSPIINTELIFDDEDFVFDSKPKEKKQEKKETFENNIYVNTKKTDPALYNKSRELKETKKEVKYEAPKTNTMYSNKVKETKSKTFTPSPIISPIYGILDKNYKKEEVKENKEIRISSRPSRLDVDSIRNKAFGDLEYDLFLDRDDEKEIEEHKNKNKKEEIEKREKHKEEIKKIYNKETDSKPSIDKVTLGEADEYYNDLGLAYNTDYKDLSKEESDGKVQKVKNEDNLEDNLFDLIESMYDKEE